MRKSGGEESLKITLVIRRREQCDARLQQRKWKGDFFGRRCYRTGNRTKRAGNMAEGAFAGAAFVLRVTVAIADDRCGAVCQRGLLRLDNPAENRMQDNRIGRDQRGP